MVAKTRKTMQVIKNETQLRETIEKLCTLEPIFLQILEKTGMPEVRLRPQGFEALFNAIIGQQLSVKAAQTIRDRLISQGLNNAEKIKTTPDDELRNYGLSRQKISYLRSLVEHEIDYKILPKMDDESVIQTLTAVKGIGRWTAEIYLLFSLNRHDVFAHNDLALQVACEKAFSLGKRPSEKIMRGLARLWSPHRSAASYLLWAYYAVLKNRDATL